MKRGEVRILGDDAVALMVGGPEAAQALAQHLRADDRWEEVVAGLDSVAVSFDSAVTGLEAAQAALDAVAATGSLQTETMTCEPVDVPVRYGGEDGPDLERVAAACGLGTEALIARHLAGSYRIAMIGFTPGFAYLTGGDPALDVARLPHPRAHVPAGSVGLSAGYCGLYALQGPGGWPLIGRTRLTLFDPGATSPFRLQAGMRLRFVREGGP